LGVSELIQSPTYVIMKAYAINWHGFKRLVHIDAYRFEKPKELQALNPEEFLLDPQALVCVEWPERVKGELPEPDMILRFSHIRDELNGRKIDILPKS